MMTGGKEQIFTCCQCGGTFAMQNDAESRQEYEQRFGLQYDPKDTVIVCDDCFEAFDKFMEEEGHKLPDGSYFHPDIPRKIH